jgi:hypothetical protein
VTTALRDDERAELRRSAPPQHRTDSAGPLHVLFPGDSEMARQSAEETEKVVSARRLETLRKLGTRSTEVRTVQSACQEAAAVLRDNPRDIPFAAIYVIRDGKARLDALVLHPDGHRLPMYASDALKNQCRSGSGLSIDQPLLRSADSECAQWSQENPRRSR